MKVVEKNNIIKNERENLEKIIKERVKSNTNIFNKEDIEIITQNINLVSKIYVLGLLDKEKSGQKVVKKWSEFLMIYNHLLTHLHFLFLHLNEYKYHKPYLLKNVPLILELFLFLFLHNIT